MTITWRWLCSSAVAALLVLAAGTALSTSSPSEPIRAQPQPPGGRVSPCTGMISSTVSADTIRMCDPLTVTVRIEPKCQTCQGGINVVFIQMDVADQGDWMIQESLGALAELRSLATQFPVSVGVVRYGYQDVRTVLRMTSQINAATGPLSAPVTNEPYLSGPYWQAARAALNMLVAARSSGPDSTMKPCEFIVFFAYGKGTAGLAMVEAARIIHTEKVNLFVGCASDSVHDECLNAAPMTKSRQNFTAYNERGKLRRMFDSTMDDLAGDQTVRDLYLTQFLPRSLAYIDGSASVPPVGRSTLPDGRAQIGWEWKRLRSMEPLTLTYQARPLAEGLSAISGTLKLVDMASLQRDVIMATSAVTVSGLCLPDPSPTPADTATPTATDTSTAVPTFTATSIPTVTPTDTPSPTPSATPTPTPGALYFPLLLHEQCTPDTRRVDVVLAIDASSSMTEHTPAGRMKIEAAVIAARAFLDELRFDRGDQAAIVAFNATATLIAPLTGDRAALEAALASIQTAPQTCLACAVETAAAELTGPRHVRLHTATLILLTDGRSNPRPVGEAVDRANEAKARGVVVFTIGLGIDLDDAALAAMASRPGYFYRAPGAEELAGIYEQIAVEIPCPAEAFWGGR